MPHVNALRIACVITISAPVDIHSFFTTPLSLLELRVSRDVEGGFV
jgi:hypothetical protein